MNVENIPFVALTGVKEKDNGLALEFRDELQNHIQTFHAGAQFTLAEAGAGLYLQNQFPELEGKVIPVLRESKLKYKRPAVSEIFATASCTDEELQRFKIQFDKKGRATIEVLTHIVDSNKILTCEGSFTFFVQTL